MIERLSFEREIEDLGLKEIRQEAEQKKQIEKQGRSKAMHSVIQGRGIKPSLALPRPKKSMKEVISGFPRYQKDVQTLPLQERTKIDKIARNVAGSFSTNQPIQIIRLTGHSDRDTPRRPDFEMKMSEERSQKIKSALMDAIDRHAKAFRHTPPSPPLSKRIFWQQFAAGATHLAVKNTKNELDRARNRRVEVLLTPTLATYPDCCFKGTERNSLVSLHETDESLCKTFQECLESSTTIRDHQRCLEDLMSQICIPLPRPITKSKPRDARVCCMLADPIVDPSDLGDHGSGNEKNGIIYTGKAGFIDLAHLRDLCDWTKYIYDQIQSNCGLPSEIRTAHGRAVVHAPIARSYWIQVARGIAYDDSFAYEIWSYDCIAPGLHNSSFSPEDLCSNYLGTLLAERALTSGGIFNVAATQELRKMLKSLDAQTKAESENAFKLISQCWVDISPWAAKRLPGYLKRRNFDRIPWHVGHPSDSPIPTWVTRDLGVALFYTYTFEYGMLVANCPKRIIPEANFASEVIRIKQDAKAKYGKCFDRPNPCQCP